MNVSCAPRKQRGSVLLVALIFLVLFTLLAITTFRGSSTTVQAIGNMQWRSEAVAAANNAIDALLSDPLTFTMAPQDAFVFNYDVNGDGSGDIAVRYVPDGRAGPRCIRFEPIPTNQLNPQNPQDLQCFGSGTAANPGIAIETEVTNAQGQVTGVISESIAQYPPLCANTEWSLALRASDLVTNTSVDVVQGVGVRVSTTTVDECD